MIHGRMSECFTSYLRLYGACLGRVRLTREMRDRSSALGDVTGKGLLLIWDSRLIKLVM